MNIQKYNDFIWRWNQRPCNYDGAYGNQCVDIIRQYCTDVFGVNGYTAIPSTGSAINIFNNFKSNAYFKKVINNPNDLNHPKKGDIVFYKQYFGLYGKDGHTEVVDQADGYFMVNFSQNWPTGKWCGFVKRGSNKLFHGYRGCVGWLTPLK